MYYVKKYLKFIIIFFVIIVIVISYFVINSFKVEDKISENDTIVAYVETTSEAITEVTNINNFYVDVKGEVKNPGVYFVSEGMLVIDAINLAGGLTKKACTDDINLSMKLTNEMVIYINNKSNFTTTTKATELNDAKVNKSTNTSEGKINGLVNINTASKEELMSISGIGESKANSIIEYRKENIFKTIEDIKNVSGIGEKFFEQIKNYITV